MQTVFKTAVKKNNYSQIILVVFSVMPFIAISQQQFKEEIITSLRSKILLNGQWNFQPAVGIAEQNPVNDWGLIQVPGAWATDGVWWQDVPGMIKSGTSKLWNDSLNKLSRGWYMQQVFIPASWKKKIVELELEKVATDAVLFINGKNAGIIEWYAGKLDITQFVKFGTVNEIRILVIATPNQGDVVNLMGTAQAQVSFSKATLATRGITGNVVLSSRPKGIHVTDVFVQTSVRKKTIVSEVELKGIEKPTDVLFISTIYDSSGKVALSFSEKVTTQKNDVQIFKLQTGFAKPLLWDLDEPHLYKLLTTVSVAGKIIDEHVQPFGFREFWSIGKFFYLNGTRINLRPAMTAGGDGMTELIAASIDGLRKNGFNFNEIWPGNFDIRGDIKDWHELMDAADKKGFLLSGVVLPFTNYIVDNSWSFQWNKVDVKRKWQERMLYELKRQRNHPSVVMWGTSANFFGHSDDQNPLNIGQTNWVKGNEFWQRSANAGKEAIEIVKQFDPTRLVFTHHGAYVGDIHTLNFYLNVIPLQEREEWMSYYSTHGKLPFMAVEFGTPLHCTFLRGRTSFGNNVKTEPLVTEFASMYVGPNAYQQETTEYRELIKNNFIGKQQYKAWVDASLMERMPAFQSVQYLFSKNTWRSWRTWEVPGGMIPWNKGHGWTISKSHEKEIQMPPFEAGRRGNYFSKVSNTKVNVMQPYAWDVWSGGNALIENNNEVLAYIAGSEAAFTEKDHHYKPGDWIKKQFYFFNDTRAPQTSDWNAQLIIEGKVVESMDGKIYLPVGEKKSQSFQYQLPHSQKVFKQEGQLILSATINGKKLIDSFSLRIFVRPTPSLKIIHVFDPEGYTKNMLVAAGYQVNNWDGDEKIPFLVIGCNAMLSTYKKPFDLESFVYNGGKVLVMNQHPDSIARKKGFRPSEFISRYVFPVNKKHSLFAGFDGKDFTNWTGHSKLIEDYPDYINQSVKKGAYDIPYYGWHWGNRGGVATGSVEKPHRTAWRPLMECEFDMAWTPLMELPYGKGHVIWNNLDVEDHYDNDIVAALMVDRLLTYVDTLQPQPRSLQTILLGSTTDANLLDDVGLIYKRNDEIIPETDLLLVGEITTAQEKELLAFIEAGGKALILPRKKINSFLGVEYIEHKNFPGAYEIPDWPEAAGLSVSDTRFRTSYSTLVVNKGCDVAAGGLMGKKNIGKGQVLFIQFDPDRFYADSLTYFRFTRWRQTRALSQVIANMGGSFIMDQSFFKTESPATYSIQLDGKWKAKMIKPLPAAKDVADKYTDPGISNEAFAYMQSDADETDMVDIVSGVSFEKANSEWSSFDGEIVFRKKIEVPISMLGEDLLIKLSVLDDYDMVYFNGVLIGKTSVETPSVWSHERIYKISAKLVKEGANVIAIRLFDVFGGGGLMPSSTKREIIPLVKKKVQGFYHADYLNDFEIGDDPFRYFRW